MKKQYRYGEGSSFKYIITLYHDGELVDIRELWLDELDDEIDKLEEQGYVHGYTREEVEKAKQTYERMLKNIIG